MPFDKLTFDTVLREAYVHDIEYESTDLVIEAQTRVVDEAIFYPNIDTHKHLEVDRNMLSFTNDNTQWTPGSAPEDMTGWEDRSIMFYVNVFTYPPIEVRRNLARARTAVEGKPKMIPAYLKNPNHYEKIAGGDRTYASAKDQYRPLGAYNTAWDIGNIDWAGFVNGSPMDTAGKDIHESLPDQIRDLREFDASYKWEVNKRGEVESQIQAAKLMYAILRRENKIIHKILQASGSEESIPGETQEIKYIPTEDAWMNAIEAITNALMGFDTSDTAVRYHRSTRATDNPPADVVDRPTGSVQCEILDILDPRDAKYRPEIFGKRTHVSTFTHVTDETRIIDSNTNIKVKQRLNVARTAGILAHLIPMFEKGYIDIFLTGRWMANQRLGIDNVKAAFEETWTTGGATVKPLLSLIQTHHGAGHSEFPIEWNFLHSINIPDYETFLDIIVLGSNKQLPKDEIILGKLIPGQTYSREAALDAFTKYSAEYVFQISKEGKEYRSDLICSGQADLGQSNW